MAAPDSDVQAMHRKMLDDYLENMSPNKIQGFLAGFLRPGHILPTQQHKLQISSAKVIDKDERVKVNSEPREGALHHHDLYIPVSPTKGTKDANRFHSEEPDILGHTRRLNPSDLDVQDPESKIPQTPRSSGRSRSDSVVRPGESAKFPKTPTDPQSIWKKAMPRQLTPVVESPREVPRSSKEPQSPSDSSPPDDPDDSYMDNSLVVEPGTQLHQDLATVTPEQKDARGGESADDVGNIGSGGGKETWVPRGDPFIIPCNATCRCVTEVLDWEKQGEIMDLLPKITKVIAEVSEATGVCRQTILSMYNTLSGSPDRLWADEQAAFRAVWEHPHWAGPMKDEARKILKLAPHEDVDILRAFKAYRSTHAAPLASLRERLTLVAANKKRSVVPPRRQVFETEKRFLTTWVNNMSAMHNIETVLVIAGSNMMSDVGNTAVIESPGAVNLYQDMYGLDHEKLECGMRAHVSKISTRLLIERAKKAKEAEDLLERASRVHHEAPDEYEPFHNDVDHPVPASPSPVEPKKGKATEPHIAPTPTLRSSLAKISKEPGSGKPERPLAIIRSPMSDVPAPKIVSFQVQSDDEEDRVDDGDGDEEEAEEDEEDDDDDEEKVVEVEKKNKVVKRADANGPETEEDLLAEFARIPEDLSSKLPKTRKEKIVFLSRKARIYLAVILTKYHTKNFKKLTDVYDGKKHMVWTGLGELLAIDGIVIKNWPGVHRDHFPINKKKGIARLGDVHIMELLDHMINGTMYVEKADPKTHEKMLKNEMPVIYGVAPKGPGALSRGLTMMGNNTVSNAFGLPRIPETSSPSKGPEKRKGRSVEPPVKATKNTAKASAAPRAHSVEDNSESGDHPAKEDLSHPVKEDLPPRRTTRPRPKPKALKSAEIVESGDEDIFDLKKKPEPVKPAQSRGSKRKSSEAELSDHEDDGRVGLKRSDKPPPKRPNKRSAATTISKNGGKGSQARSQPGPPAVENTEKGKISLVEARRDAVYASLKERLMDYTDAPVLRAVRTLVSPNSNEDEKREAYKLVQERFIEDDGAMDLVLTTIGNL